MRLDATLAQQHPELSRSQLQQYIKIGLVSVNGKVIVKPSFDIAEDDAIDFDLPEAPDYSEDIASFRANVIYEDDNVVVVNKPAGVLSHAKGGIEHEFTVADFVANEFNAEERSKLGDNNRLGIVHRLDRATSGVMIAARNIDTYHLLTRQFADRKAHKTYLAVVEHTPKSPAATIDLPIGRNFAQLATFKVDASGKSAITNYRVLKEYDDGKALLELKPLTGRTHQLRVHLSYIGCPIVGDTVYGHGRQGDRLMLHAWQLEITIPGEPANQRQTFIAPPPEIFNIDDEVLHG